MKKEIVFDWVLARMDLTGENEEEETEEFQEKKRICIEQYNIRVFA